MPTLLLASLALTIGIPVAMAATTESGLTLETNLQESNAQSSTQRESLPTSPDAARTPADAPLKLSRDWRDGADTPGMQQANSQNTPATAQPAVSSMRSRTQIAAELRIVWVLAALFLGLHVLRSWIEVLQLRLRSEPRHPPAEHGEWPVVSLLIAPMGSAAEQAARLDHLSLTNLDYPVDKLHFVPAYDPADSKVATAVQRMIETLGERVHPLPFSTDASLNLASMLDAAIAGSIGTALVILDQAQEPGIGWLKASVAPMLDPGVGSVLSRVGHDHDSTGLWSRVSALADRADELLATQAHGLQLLIRGKAVVRTLRRQAAKSLARANRHPAADGAELVIALTRKGWQSVLLCHGTCVTTRPKQPPRLRLWLALRCLGLALPHTSAQPRLAVEQGHAASMAAALPIVWLVSLCTGLLLLLLGDPLIAGLAITLCAFTSFDPGGNPSASFTLGVAARLSYIRDETRLMPLACIHFLDRIVAGFNIALRTSAQSVATKAKAETTPLPSARLGETG